MPYKCLHLVCSFSFSIFHSPLINISVYLCHSPFYCFLNVLGFVPYLIYSLFQNGRDLSLFSSQSLKVLFLLRVFIQPKLLFLQLLIKDKNPIFFHESNLFYKNLLFFTDLISLISHLSTSDM